MKEFTAVTTMGDFLPSLNIIIQTFFIWYSYYTLDDYGHHPMVMLDFARSLFGLLNYHTFIQYLLCVRY